MAHGVLVEVVLVLAASVVMAALLRRFSVPPAVSFILAGVLIGPGGLGLVSDLEQIEVLAEVGVILLLFTVGLKISLADLWTMRRAVFAGGGLQVGLTLGATVLALTVLGGVETEPALVWGLLIALSSTALVLWLLESIGETGSLEGRTAIAVLLFQDLAVIPALLVLPVLAGAGGRLEDVVAFVLRAVAVLAVVVVAGRVVFPRLTARVVASGSRELFTLTTVLVAVGTALVVGSFGISVALGAFLAGIVITESEYVSRMAADITPLRDVFNSLFFVSMGMLVDTALWVHRPLAMLGLVAAIVAGKAAIAGLAGLVAVRSAAAALVAGLGLAQIGEFSFVLAFEAQGLGLLDQSAVRLFLSLAVPTMVLAPAMLGLGRRLADRVAPRPRPTCSGTPPEAFADHVVVVGYGINGRNVARALARLGVQHVVVDLNPATVRQIEADGGLALLGDARQAEVLEAVGVARARALIAAIPDAASTREVVAAARAAAPELEIIARTRYLREVEPLHALGADQVIPEEFETSLELTGRVLALYGVPVAAVEREKAALRQRHYGALRVGDGAFDGSRLSLTQLLDHAELAEVEVGAAGCTTLRELDLRARTGATVVALRRGDEVSPNPPADLCLVAGDVLLVMGGSAELEAVRVAVDEQGRGF